MAKSHNQSSQIVYALRSYSIERHGSICTTRLNLRVVAGFSAAFCLALTFASLPAAQQWTLQQRAACETDAMRLCNQYIPDVQRVSACIRDTPAVGVAVGGPHGHATHREMTLRGESLRFRSKIDRLGLGWS